MLRNHNTLIKIKKCKLYPEYLPSVRGYLKMNYRLVNPIWSVDLMTEVPVYVPGDDVQEWSREEPRPSCQW
jgi:hypothetical protein